MTQTTPYSEGPLNADICFVAEAPSTHELVQQRPLVGPAGRLFNDFLASEEITRSECRIENVVREKISNVDAFFEGSTSRLTELGRMAQADLKLRLQKLTKPHTIVSMGALATACLVGDRRITKLRGSPLECKLLPGVEVIPCIHPAAAMKYKGNYLSRYSIMADMRKAKRHSYKPGVIDAGYELLIRPKYHDVLDFLFECRKAQRCGFDIEIYNHQVSCLSFAPDPKTAMSIPLVGDDSDHYWTQSEEAAIWREIAILLGDTGVEKIGQYVTFDISFLLLQNRIRTRGPILDTYTACRVLYPEFPATLEFLCANYTDQAYYKDDRKIWNRLDADIERFWRYNARDSVVAYEAWEGLEPALLADEMYKITYDNSLENLEPCLYMMTAGVKLDPQEIANMRAEIDRRLEAAKARWTEQAGLVNPGSAKQVMAYFYVTKGVKPYLHQKTRRPTCDDKALARIIRRDNLPEARTLQEIRNLSKLKTSYLEMAWDPDDRLRCFYNIRGTISGRLSSSKTVRETGMNMQNVHPQFKRFVVPD